MVGRATGIVCLFASCSIAWPQVLSFSAGASYPAQKAPLATASADFNGDGKADLAVANAGSSTVSIFLGKGDGTFNTLSTVTIPNGCLADNLTAGDFNNDGKIDLLVVCGFQSAIWVLPGLGTGQFGTPISTVLSQIALEGWAYLLFSNVTVADFNRDGNLDLVMIASSSISSHGTPLSLQLELLLGKGDGTFQQPSAILQGNYLAGVVVTADFDGDGNPDLVTDMYADTTMYTSGSLEVLRGDGHGSFHSVATYPTQGAPLLGGITVADVNRDGKPDLIVAEGIGGKQDTWSSILTVYTGNGDCTFNQGTSISETDSIAAIAAADFRNNGMIDVVEEHLVVASDDLPIGENTLTLRAGNGDGTFQDPMPISMPAGLAPWWFHMTMGDWNGDGLPDLAFTASATSTVLTGYDGGNNPIDLVIETYQSMPAGDLVVMLNALTPPPAIALSIPQLQFTSVAGGMTPPAQSVTISNGGSGTLSWTATPSAPWLSVTPKSGTGTTAVSIAATPGSMQAGSYSGTIQIAATGAWNSPLTISVTLTISAPSTLPTVTSVVNGASFQPGIEAGSWVTITGTNLSNTNPGRTWRSDEIVDGKLPTSLDGVSVTIDGKAAFVYYISPTQLNVQAPTDAVIGTVNVVVTNNGQTSAPGTAQLQTYAPAFFLYSGTNYAIASHFPDYGLVGNPTVIPGTINAKPGDVLILWATGFGPTNPATPAGMVVSGAPLAATTPVITVGGMQVTVVNTVLSPGSAGLYQVAIQLPDTIPSGVLAIQASGGSTQSPAGIVISIASK